ncbi:MULTISPECIES: hypothetical protein [unclassified Mesorhizobium]|uniref:hypothetical protein n=1 Tax=unclassified Mesorhizobium TaxID=325217 RepID=UPI0012ECA56C|nr:MULTISPECIES: hypothetical protein [unclassified Mesorhizobium]WJI69525.1 hypothetical protein NLY36_01585 [Mesorhizobium sp. C399B]
MADRAYRHGEKPCFAFREGGRTVVPASSSPSRNSRAGVSRIDQERAVFGAAFLFPALRGTSIARLVQSYCKHRRRNYYGLH